MEKPIKIYYESKKRALMYGSIFIILSVFMIFKMSVLEENDILFNQYLVKFYFYFLVVFGFIFYFYPLGVLEVYKDKFVYKKGKFLVSANWSEVVEIAFQVSRPSGGISGAFFIDTTRGATKLIDTMILKSKDNSKTVSAYLLNFVQELEQISGKVVKVGEISTKQYGKASFRDHCEGVEKINNFWK